MPHGSRIGVSGIGLAIGLSVMAGCARAVKAKDAGITTATELRDCFCERYPGEGHRSKGEPCEACGVASTCVEKIQTVEAFDAIVRELCTQFPESKCPSFGAYIFHPMWARGIELKRHDSLALMLRTTGAESIDQTPIEATLAEAGMLSVLFDAFDGSTEWRRDILERVIGRAFCCLVPRGQESTAEWFGQCKTWLAGPGSRLRFNEPYVYESSPDMKCSKTLLLIEK